MAEDCTYDSDEFLKTVFFNRNRSKADVIDYLKHQPFCKVCLAHDNSYLFRAYYDISRWQVENLVSAYDAYYPEHLTQPIFHPWDNGRMWMRMQNTPDILYKGEDEGEIKLESLEVEFTLCLWWPKDDDGMLGKHSNWVTYKFDLSREAGWREMLRVFPQKERVV